VPGASDEAVACDAGPGRKLPAERQVSSLLRNVTQQHSDDFVSHTLDGPDGLAFPFIVSFVSLP